MNQKLKILIAEDDEAVRQMLTEALPHDLRMASNGAECLEMLGRETFDLLLLDIMLPKVSGVMLLRTLKERHPELAVVVMTGFADALRQQILAMGVDGFLEKPFSSDAVRSAIQKAMGHRPKPKQET